MSPFILLMNQTKNTDMKAEEILERHLRVSSAIPLSTLQKHFVLIAMEEYAQQFQFPPVSEEEIEEEIINAACERIPREKTFAIQRQLAFIQGARWALSRLPQLGL